MYKCNGVADLLKHAPPRYHAEFVRTALKGVGINPELPKLWITWVMTGVADPDIHAPPLHVLPRQIW